MHRKVKQVLSGLTMAAIVTTGALMFGEPVSKSNQANTLTLDVMQEDRLVTLAADTASETPAANQSAPSRFKPQQRMQWRMPYFSFGATLKPAPKES